MLRQLGYDALPSVPGGLRVNALELWYFLGQGQRFRRLARLFGRGRAGADDGGADAG
jgi:hypothetical protein